ncbi:aldo/keto reductase [Amycolatopsis cihanbeyliensis]|uniref:Aryl-alcohol dehydrogenase-like predicted oxidoreductase n=1 Tax=Amycolatopsis cihanbeyliensis TaxID=1128664 RepID=A0A542DRA0_AMYCI|nr:aldo/keto reductase [Amycolatopsis cihanbeyliensis]TQJ05524.1 aryl-alcohol dehydrogenase-like predicted oxidoreductase [Amycolatopsis cihanbeyliensis]
MEYRRLGDSGLTVSEIAYGNWLTHDTSVRCVRAALDAGVNLFHTAAAWAGGAAEEALAEGLAETPREDVVLSTGAFWPEGARPNRRGLSRKHLFASLHGSLRRLRTDYVDLYHLLGFDYQTPLEETFLALSDLVRQGKIHYVGTAEWTADQIQRAAVVAAEYRVPLVANQPHYSMLWRVPEAQVVPACQRAGMGQLASVAMAQGVLTGKYADGLVPEGSRAEVGGFARGSIAPLLHPELLARIEPLRGVAENAGLTMAQLAIAWALQNHEVAAVLTGASSPDQVVENVKASGRVLELDVLTQVDHLLGSFVQTDPRLTFTPPQYRNA